MNNPELALALIKVHLVDLNDYFSLVRPMSMDQINQTAELILSEYPIIKIADLIYTFKQAKLGYFGKLFESLDGMKILSWIDQIFNERCDAGAMISEREHMRTKQEYNELFVSQRLSDEIELQKRVSAIMKQNSEL